MCIIAYLPKDATISEDTIKTMFEGNPDGAGLMWKVDEKTPVQIRKGFMKVDDLIKAYNDIPTSCERAIHCRIATAGKVSVACCHPFPVRQKVGAMKSAKDKADIALMHNGVIGYANPPQGIKSDYSDSMNFAAKFLYPLRKELDKECIRTLIEESTTSRLLIMRESADTIMLGNWIYDDGVYYSNDSYLSASKRWSKYYDCNYSYANYGYDDDDSFGLIEGIYLDIGNDPQEEAIKKVTDACELYQQQHPEEYVEYEVAIDPNGTGELLLEGCGLPAELSEIAGYKISERALY